MRADRVTGARKLQDKSRRFALADRTPHPFEISGLALEQAAANERKLRGIV
jgi:hypothetical protein